MNTRDLALFLDLSNTLHFTQTGRNCHISTSALTRVIQRLEAEVGQALFIRNNRTVTLAPAGERFRSYAQEAIANWQDLQNDLMSRDQLSGQLRIYCSVTASYTILFDLLGGFRRAQPNVEIDLHTGSAEKALEMVAQDQADISVLAKPDRLPDAVCYQEVVQTPLQFVAPNADGHVNTLSKRKRVPWSDVPMILPERGVARERIDHWFRQRRTQPKIYAQVSGNEAILAMVGLGCGIGVVPGLVLETSPFQNDVAVIPVTPELSPYSVGICAGKRRLQSPVVAAFWDMV